jgi:hypothetical protein
MIGLERRFTRCGVLRSFQLTTTVRRALDLDTVGRTAEPIMNRHSNANALAGVGPMSQIASLVI